MTTEEAMTDATENEMETESEIENDLSESSDIEESDNEISELSEEGEVSSEDGTVAANETNVVGFPANATEHAELMRMTEALLFAAAEPLDIDSITSRLPEGADVGAVIEDLQKLYEERGVNLSAWPISGCSEPPKTSHSSWNAKQ